MENVENLILEDLRALRDGQAAIVREVSELRVRIGSLESHVAGLRRGIALLHEDVAAVNARLDHHEERLARIERRLELTPA